jgi:cytosine/uracil/thiamine/allantoin permease
MPSQSPKSRAPKKATDEELLNVRIESNTIEYPQQLLLAVGGLTAFLPAYIAHAFHEMSWGALANLPIFAAVTAITAYLLSQAYAVMFESEFLKRQRHYSETKTDGDAKTLRQLRLQVALAYTVALVNGVFVAGVTFLQGYMFRKQDPRVAYTVSPLIAAALLWLIAQKNEESRKRMTGRK